MESYIFESKDRTVPSIDLNPKDGIFKIQGSSLPDNSNDFYKPIFDFFLQYETLALSKSEFHLFFEYFNTSTSKCLFDIFSILSRINKSGKEVIVYWNYVDGDDDMLDSGKDFAEYSGLKFIYIVTAKNKRI